MNGNGRLFTRPDGRSYQGDTRSEKRAANNLGVVVGGPFNYKFRKFRSKALDIVESYLEGRQYDHLQPWQECCSTDTYTEIKKRKPSVVFPFAKTYQDRVASKLAGSSVFPTFSVENDPDTTYFLGLVRKASFFDAKMLDAAKKFVSYTSAFVRFRIMNGAPKIEVLNPNYCYPTFDDVGNLTSVTIKYIYETDELDPRTGKMVCKWYKEELGLESDILYDNPIFDENSQNDPEFQVVEQVDHGLGMVQGEWFRFGENQYDLDGESEPTISEIRGFIDAINYNLSMSDSATNYGMDPQLVLKGIDKEDVDKIIKSAEKAWILGRPEADAKFLENTGSGVQRGKEMEDRLIKRATDAARIVFLDPEKMVGTAQSGKAMEVMHAPLVELIHEMRPWFEKGMTSLLTKMATVLLYLEMSGADTVLEVPPGWVPGSLQIDCGWGPVFPLTIQDMQQIISAGLQAANGNIIARDTAAKWMQKMGVDFGVEDWEAETAKINAQKTFGGFF